MEMEVIDALPAVTTGIDDYSVTTAKAQFRGQLASDPQHVS
jgi:hypothetical protein